MSGPRSRPSSSAGALLLALLGLLLPAAVVVAPTAAGAAPAPAVGAEKALTSARPGRAHVEPDVAWNGDVHLVVWTEVAGPIQHVYGARVRRDGTVLDPRGIQLSTSDSNHVAPTVAGGGGRFLVMWEEAPEGTFSDLAGVVLDSRGRIVRRIGIAVDNDQRAPSVTWGGGMFFAAWEDSPEPDDYDVYGARVLPDGTVLDGCATECPLPDELGIPIGLGAGNQLRPSVAWDGGGYTVAFTAPSTTAGQTAIRANRVARNGTPYFGDTGYVLADRAGNERSADLAANRGAVLAVWELGDAVHRARWRPGDSVCCPYDPVPTTPTGGGPLGSSPQGQATPSVAPRGDGFVVAWVSALGSEPDVRVTRVGRAGGVVDTAGFPFAARPGVGERLPSVADAGTRQLVAYVHEARSEPYDGRQRVFLRTLG